MNEEYAKLFVRQSGGKLFHLIDQMKRKDPSERINLSQKKTREIFIQSGLSDAEHGLWRDTKMLSKMESIAIAMWNRLNENNLKIQMEFEECIADNRNEYSWKDISLSWEEAEEIAAEEYVRHLATQSSNSKKQRTNQETIKTKSISYKEMKEKIKRSIGYTDTAIQRATHRALKKALEEKIKPPIPMGGCVDSFAIQEIHSFDKLKGPTVDSCKYICIRQVTD